MCLSSAEVNFTQTEELKLCYITASGTIASLEVAFKPPVKVTINSCTSIASFSYSKTKILYVKRLLKTDSLSKSNILQHRSLQCNLGLGKKSQSI